MSEQSEREEREAFQAWSQSTPEFAPEFQMHRGWAEAFAWDAWQARGRSAVREGALTAQLLARLKEAAAHVHKNAKAVGKYSASPDDQTALESRARELAACYLDEIVRFAAFEEAASPPTPTSRNVTAQEDLILRGAARRSAKIIASPSTVSQPVENPAVAWQYRTYHTDSGDEGWGIWWTVNEAEANFMRGRKNVEIRALYAAPPVSQQEPIPDEYYCLETMTAPELRAYEYANAEGFAELRKLLDGKDDGSGDNHEPWHTIRRELLELRSKALAYSAFARAAQCLMQP